MNERLCLWMALACYAAASAVTIRRLQRREAAGALHGVNVAIMVVGFALHTLALYLRGQHLHRCPLTNLFEVQVFIAWSAVLFYLLIGPSYRVSFLGAFTAPLVLAVLLTVLLAPVDDDDLERLLVARSPRFQALLSKSRQSIQSGKGLSRNDFWKAVKQRHNRPAA